MSGFQLLLAFSSPPIWSSSSPIRFCSPSKFYYNCVFSYFNIEIYYCNFMFSALY